MKIKIIRKNKETTIDTTVLCNKIKRILKRILQVLALFSFFLLMGLEPKENVSELKVIIVYTFLVFTVFLALKISKNSE